MFFLHKECFDDFSHGAYMWTLLWVLIVLSRACEWMPRTREDVMVSTQMTGIFVLIRW